MQKTLKIFFHDNCFDGTASAAVFSDFYQKHVNGRALHVYQGVQHCDGDPFAGLPVDGDDNACLDFRYHEAMSWFFDHHLSAFQPPERRAHFDADVSGRKFHDPGALSCTKFMARTLSQEFGYEVPELFTELIEWAEIIDSAGFDSPKTAVALDLPATRLMTWIRYNRDAELTHRYIRELRVKSLAELAVAPWITETLDGLLAQHARAIELVRRRARYDDGVVFVDLADERFPVYNSFIAYFLFPRARYTVGLVRADGQARISVGFNPWSESVRVHNIAAICERFGGGGHLTVGGIALPAHALGRARRIAESIRCELMGGSELGAPLG